MKCKTNVWQLKVLSVLLFLKFKKLQSKIMNNYFNLIHSKCWKWNSNSTIRKSFSVKKTTKQKTQLNNLKLLKLRNENCFCGMHGILSGQPESMQQMRVRVQQAAASASVSAAAACNGCAMAWPNKKIMPNESEKPNGKTVNGKW